jgi:predicted MFS family arabinose efflux permease
LSLVVSRTHQQERGVATAFYTTLDWLALLLGGPLIGYGIEHMGYSVAFMTVAVFVAMGIGAFYVLDPRQFGPRVRNAGPQRLP